MKTFYDLREGDKVHIIGINRENNVIFNRVATYFGAAYEEDNNDVYDDDLEVLIYFRETSESGIRVSLKDHMASRKLQGTGAELMYFPDPVAAENYLKKLKDETIDFLGKIDQTYKMLWKLEEESKQENPREYKVGDLIYSESYHEVCLFDGESGVFADGIELKSVRTVSGQNRKATSEEIKVFFQDCSRKLRTNVIYVQRIKNALTKCNYSWDPGTFEIFKNPED
jgi:hypothetical protein